ncbi:alpha/beta fold hydrolase [Actinomadura decatromicini]|uniref:Alpha/beta hydrolase n=1 Tax=Actinomadura decatromicini TaxID=2604572 RepID=A0A5D3FAE7_9ACTN|nr:alpha/beta hydrolase [Actinomadura decatromicini]TYK44335.1 alpha/beta hydrolase [Actinomadura decatromicini]
MTTNERALRKWAEPALGRRGLLGGAAALAAGGAAFAASGGSAFAAGGGAPRPDSPLPIIPIPPQAPATEGYAPVPGGRVWYWDTGGHGTPIVLLHAYSGSAESWPYQQPYLAKAGFRVIGYSRRGHFKSDAPPADNPGTGAGDLHALVEHLGIRKFHAVGVAAGGGVALDYALSHPERLLGLVISGSLTGAQDQDYKDMLKRLRPPGFAEMPADFIELGPSYRAVNVAGTAAWVDIHHRARNSTVDQGNENTFTWADVKQRVRVPTLLLWGDADLYSPPSVQRIMASHFRDVETVVANECGHAPQWERSDVYNPVLRAFVRKHSR